MKPSILIVEDSILISRHLAVLVENAGFPICGICETGEEAITVASACKPGIVLMDITLAGLLDGIATARIIKRTIDTNIVFLSALAALHKFESHDIESKFFTKPFDDKEVLDFLEGCAKY